MSKNIILCSDGTGNTAIKGRGTNVFKLFEALDLTSHREHPERDPQVAFYDDGVGTQNFKPLKIFAGMTGYGLSRNVKSLYKELVRVYDKGDQIFLFGFSRGAFTVRTLTGLIARCGLLDRDKLRSKEDLDSAVKQVYRVYRRCYRTRLAELFKGKVDTDITKEFKKTRCLPYEVKIKFLGVWDTVDAVGMPFHLSDVLNLTIYRFKFPDARLSSIVERAYHALAIDEQRHSFSPLLWDESNGETRARQVWFPGVHSNVGGGYPKQGISVVALDWMMTAAEEAGLRFIHEDRRFYRDHVNFDDKLYDSRSGLGIFYRWKIRDIEALCAESSIEPKVHLSTFERIAHGAEGYSPGNLPRSIKLEVTPLPISASAESLQRRAEKVEGALNQNASIPPINLVRGAITIGLVSYYVYLAACILLLIVASGAASYASLIRPWRLFGGIGRLVFGAITSPVGTLSEAANQLRLNPWLALSVGCGFVLAYLLSLFADSRMEGKFSEYWNSLQPKLREALKGARSEVLRESTSPEVANDGKLLQDVSRAS